MSETISDQEREFAKEVAEFAMMAGWDRSIQVHARKSGLKETQIILILNNASKYNDKSDPNGRINSLADWEQHKIQPEVSLPAKGQGKSQS